MNIVETIEAGAASVAAHIRHAALWLIGAAAEAQKEVKALEVSDPLVAEAVAVGSAWASAHGVPMPAIEGATEAVLGIAQAVAAGNAAAAPAAPAVPPTPVS